MDPVWQGELVRATLVRRVHRGAATAVSALDDDPRVLWSATIAFYVVGDVFTTHIGLQFPGVVELGPLPAIVLSTYGFSSLVLLKLATLLLAFVGWRSIPRPYHVGIPIGLLLVGFVATWWNVWIILQAAL